MNGFRKQYILNVFDTFTNTTVLQLAFKYLQSIGERIIFAKKFYFWWTHFSFFQRYNLFRQSWRLGIIPTEIVDTMDGYLQSMLRNPGKLRFPSIFQNRSETENWVVIFFNFNYFCWINIFRIWTCILWRMERFESWRSSQLGELLPTREGWRY